MIALAPGPALMNFVVLPTVEFDEAVPAAVGNALAVLVETVAEAVPIVAASTGSVGVPVVAEERQLVRHELCDRCEYAARCTTPGGSPML